MRFSVFISTTVAIVALVVGVYHVTTTSAQAQAPQQPSQAVQTSSTTVSEASSDQTQPEAPQKVPSAENTNAVSTPVPQTIGETNQPAPNGIPTKLSIPSINLDVPIISVGLNSAGEMAVPSGSTNNVGWYDGGVEPGAVGSAVIDAHVFAAFSNLRYAKVGDDIYVTEGNQQLHFQITSSMVYKTEDVPADLLFNKSDGRYLNLITCAGTYVASMGTYDHRLVDYAVLVN